MKARSIQQIINHYVIINTESKEWLYEATTYGACVEMAHAVVPVGTEYAIVAVMKMGTYKPKKQKQQQQKEQT